MKRIVQSLAASLVLFAAPAALAQQTTRESVDSGGSQADQPSDSLRVSSDGGVVTFDSLADNLVASDTNRHTDVFVRDRITGAVTRVSVGANGVEGDDESWEPALSDDGSLVAFHSRARNLVNGDTNHVRDVFVHDRATATTTRVSVDSSGAQSDGDSSTPAVSGDGRFVAFESDSTNLVLNDTNGVADVFVHDRFTGVTTRVSVDVFGNEGNAASREAKLSSDGSFVAFTSDATNLVPGDTNLRSDVFVFELRTGIVERVSIDSSGIEANRDCDDPSISGDGSRVAFKSLSDNLVSGDANRSRDVFVHSRATGATSRVSVDANGREANRDSWAPILSRDGAFVAFTSVADNLVPGDTNGAYDAFRHEIATGRIVRASVSSTGTEGNDVSAATDLSTGGRFVALVSRATNLVSGDSNGFDDVFLRGECNAQWSNYGAGWPGTLGVPTLTSSANPVLGSTITIDLSNSLGASALGLLLVGTSEASVPTNKDGTLLVAPLLFLPLQIPATGIAITATVPLDGSLCGVEIDLQVLELDPGASKGASFTPGLELVLGI